MVYNLPELQGSNGFVKAAVGGWEASTIMNFFSGAGMRVRGGMNGDCDTDFIVQAARTTDNCDPTTGRFITFSGDPWRINNSIVSSSVPNRYYIQPCHVSRINRIQFYISI